MVLMKLGINIDCIGLASRILLKIPIVVTDLGIVIELKLFVSKA